MFHRARVTGVAGALLIALSSVGTAGAASHREAPLIANDPAADNTDLYAWVDGAQPGMVNIVASYSPMQDPAGGPNFWQFDPLVRYAIHVDNDRDARADISWNLTFETIVDNPNSFLYTNGPVTSLGDENLNVKQVYRVTRSTDGRSTYLGSGRTLPANVGPRSNPDYAALASDAVKSFGTTKVFAGQTDDAFFVDLGSIFDLGGLRPFNSLHALPLADAAGVDDLQGLNVLTIALQVPITDLTSDGNAHAATDPRAVVGIWAANERQHMTVITGNGSRTGAGPWVQVSRLGNPLVNEVIIPLGQKDRWNRRPPHDDAEFATYYRNSELAAVASALYAALDDPASTGRADLELILLNGLPGLNSTGSVKADMLRLNTGIAPCTADPADDDVGQCRRLGAFYDDAADLAAWPNGRRLTDDVTDIALRAVLEGYGAQLATLYGVPNRAPNNLIGDGVGRNDLAFMGSFPYLGVSHQGYDHSHHL